jgi:hypothetical protein
MTPQKHIELIQIFEDFNTVTVTVAPHNRKSDDDAYDITYDNLGEAVSNIERLENNNTVFF